MNNKGSPWVAKFTGCCKISPGDARPPIKREEKSLVCECNDLYAVNDLDSKDMPWDISTIIDLSQQETSPRIMVF